ncbi:MAG: hypothetical protein R2695_05610 [Acidimicrobiales bacterium]
MARLTGIRRAGDGGRPPPRAGLEHVIHGAAPRWRLACPETRYFVHIADDVALISTTSRLGPVPACVILKAFPLAGGTAPVDATRAVRTATRFHRAGCRLRRVQRPGAHPRHPPAATLQRRRSTSSSAARSRARPRHRRPDTFEFLDMDAY